MTQDKSNPVDWIQKAYNMLLRPVLPRQWAVVDDIVIRAGRALDHDDWDDYEAALRDATRDLVEPGDDVLLIGGGHGASMVEASRAAGADGQVTVVEPVEDRIRDVERAHERNISPASLEIVRGSVDDVFEASRESFGAPDHDWLTRDELQQLCERHDVLISDCEGGERHLMGLGLDRGCLPDRMVIETHPEIAGTSVRGAPPRFESREHVGSEGSPQIWTLVDDDPETVAKMPRTLEAENRRDWPDLDDDDVSWPVPDGDRLAEMTEQRDGTAD